MVLKVSPNQDTGWGLIYRLNALFSEVEEFAPLGRYEDWNFKLDRIWSNLCYREDMQITRDGEKKIINVEISEDMIDIKRFLDDKIKRAKTEFNKSQRKINKDDKIPGEILNFKKAKNEYYDAILKKEVWLRKHMRYLGLYLRESRYNPSGSMWGKE
jgi:hypothetical protein